MHSFAAEFERLTALASAAGVDPADVVLPAEGMVRAADGVRLHYLEWPGPVTEPLLLFLHGGGLHAHSFDSVGLLLRRIGRCVALDLRGHGESDWAGSGGYGTDAIAADLDTVTASFGARQVVLVGHSLGGMAALVWAARRPAVLAGLVVVDVGPDIDDTTGLSINDLISRRPFFADLEEADAFLAGVLPRTREASTSGVAQNLTWTDGGMLTWKHDTAQFHPEMGRIASPDELRQAAARIACPALVLRGERSRVFSDEGAAELAALIPRARWERVPGAGHTIQTGNPRALADAMARFLNDLDDQGAE